MLAISPRIRLGVKNISFTILAKPFETLSRAKTRLKSVKNISDENLELKQRIADLSVDLFRMEGVSKENERLKELLAFSKGVPYKTIVAEVIARDSSDWRRMVIINKGKRSGIKLHMACATTRGLIGTVSEVGPDSSKVMLITDPNSRIGVIVEPSREGGVLVGSPDGSPRVIYLSLDAKVEKKDKVLTAGFGFFLPKGLPVGEVSKTEIESTSLYKFAVVDTFESLNRLEEVLCIDTARDGKY